MQVKIDLPTWAEALFQPKRYKVLYGGRGGGKSESIARAILIMAMQKPIRVLCARELQVSIKESVHHLFKDLIEEYKLGAHFEVQATAIKGKNGSEFVFKGLKHNASEIKSFHAVDICWVEEAQAVSKSSWDVLIPTIRKEGSEIWLSFNPELEEDETYQRFVIDPPKESHLLQVNWRDNPWFPDVLKAELEDLKERDFDAYLNVWEGKCKQVLEGAIYANELRKASEENRITSVPYDKIKPVHTFWDLGWADQTSIWFVQIVGLEYRIIDFYENRQQPLSHYLAKLQEKGYVYGDDWLPHDAKARSLGTGKSVEELLLEAGRKARITPQLTIMEGINAARTVFNRCWFDESKCSDGLYWMRRYRYGKTSDDQWKRIPEHDDASHAADAFRYFAIAVTDQPKAKPLKYKKLSVV